MATPDIDKGANRESDGEKKATMGPGRAVIMGRLFVQKWEERRRKRVEAASSAARSARTSGRDAGVTAGGEPLK